MSWELGVEERPSRETYSIIWYSCSPALRIDMFLPITFSGVAVLVALLLCPERSGLRWRHLRLSTEQPTLDQLQLLYLAVALSGPKAAEQKAVLLKGSRRCKCRCAWRQVGSRSEQGVCLKAKFQTTGLRAANNEKASRELLQQGCSMLPPWHRRSFQRHLANTARNRKGRPRSLPARGTYCR